MEETYDYNISYDHRYVQPIDNCIDKKSFYAKTDVQRYQQAIKEYKSSMDEYKTAWGEYNTFLRKTSDIRNHISKSVSEAVSFFTSVDQKAKLHSHYVTLLGNSEQASIMLTDNLKSNGYDQEFIDAVFTKLQLNPT